METIYDLIIKEKANYEKAVDLADGWSWSMKQHLRRSFLYENSQFEEENENRHLRPANNIILPIINVQKRTEGFDVGNITLYIDDDENFHLSYFASAYHEKWALENKIDTFIDDMVDSYVDYGGILVRDTSTGRPEVINLRTIAFCNQKDILTHPFAIRHEFSQASLREMTEWGQDKNGATIDLESLIILAEDKEEIEVFEVIGTMPSEWLTSKENKKDSQQIQIISFYKKENGDEQGVTLFRKKLPKLPFKFLARDKIAGRALGRGGVEELFEPQIWTNWGEIKIAEILEACSKIINITDDPTLISKHPSGLKDMDNLEFLQINEGKSIRVLDNQPRNLTFFNNFLDRMQARAQQLGVASEGLLGETPTAGMPFKLYEAKNIEDKSMHRFRQGQIAVFMDEIYHDWILSHLAEDMAKDWKFLAEIPLEIMQKIAKNIAVKETNRLKVKKILSGNIWHPEDEAITQKIENDYLQSGNKKFLKVLKMELADIPLKVKTSITGKQKDLALFTDKLVNLVQKFISTPQLRQDPEMVRMVNYILESSGLSPMMYGLSAQAPQMPPEATKQPLPAPPTQMLSNMPQ